MADELDNDAPQAAAAEQGSLCGERLAEARRARDILLADIAKELHIGEDKVEALERNDFETLGAAVFAKGYLRKYAQLVGLAEADLLVEYEELASASSIEPVLKARPRPRREMSPGPWIVVIVVIILAATAYWWFTEKPIGSASVAPTPPAEIGPESLQQPMSATPVVEQGNNAVLPELSAGSQAEDSIDNVTDNSSGAAEPRLPEESQVAEEPQVADEPIDDGQLRMLLTFSGDCWTEISDGSGRRLFFGLGSAGRTVELSGEPPFNALFGNAENVQLEVNGVEYVIRDAERRGRTARLTVTGS